MPNEEVEMMREMFCFLRDHNDPPADGTEDSQKFWLTAAKDAGEIAVRWKNHPLVLTVLIGLFDYLAQKGRAKGRVGEQEERDKQTGGGK